LRDRVGPGEAIAARARELLAALDAATTLPTYTGADPSFDLAQAFAVADESRSLRLARGEVPLGYKIGFTNRGIWQRYGVFGPIWGPVWDTTTERVDSAATSVSLARFVAPRLEPEIMFGIARAPRAGMSVTELAACIAWVAHGFEVVDTHFADWRFAAADTVADFALHARLFVGPRVPIERFGPAGRDAAEALAALSVTLAADGRDVETGRADIVLDGPLNALRLWVDAMAAQLQRWPISAGDIVTTGTITDAAPLSAAGVRWQTRLSDPRLVAMTLDAQA
jgi:2-oxo-3-hexenedioate decarboxylase